MDASSRSGRFGGVTLPPRYLTHARSFKHPSTPQSMAELAITAVRVFELMGNIHRGIPFSIAQFQLNMSPASLNTSTYGELSHTEIWVGAARSILKIISEAKPKRAPPAVAAPVHSPSLLPNFVLRRLTRKAGTWLFKISAQIISDFFMTSSPMLQQVPHNYKNVLHLFIFVVARHSSLFMIIS